MHWFRTSLIGRESAVHEVTPAPKPGYRLAGWVRNSPKCNRSHAWNLIPPRTMKKQPRIPRRCALSGWPFREWESISAPEVFSGEILQLRKPEKARLYALLMNGRLGFVVSHPFARKKANGWGTGTFWAGSFLDLTRLAASQDAQDDSSIVERTSDSGHQRL